jgi:hypothetical protein
MNYGAAQQHWLNAMVSQQTMLALSDYPGEFRGSPESALFRQAWHAREGRSGGMNYLTVPF